ncbi:MAG: hypothetical protein ACI8XO_002348 [Verrucomicrobiales bacterium]|jgi:hypothetical protein
MKIPQSLVAISLFVSTLSLSAFAQDDDFNDGNSEGWSELAPLAAVGVTATYTFPEGNRYRLQSAPSTNEDAFGPARMGSIREDVSYTDFYQFVDVVEMDETLDQNIGMLARVSDVGLGTTDGYGLTYNPTEQSMFLTAITNEAGTTVGMVDAPVAPGEPVRLVFQGVGDSFKCELYRLSDLETPVATIEETDSTYGEGFSGILLTSDPADTPIGVDCTFDNYLATQSEPSGFSLIAMRLEGDRLVFDFNSVPNARYILRKSDDLIHWDEETDDIRGALALTTRFSILKPAVACRYYEIREP